MNLQLKPLHVLIFSLVPFSGCGEKENCALSDNDCDGVPDNLGRAVDVDGEHGPDSWDYNGDGKLDGYAVDRNDDGKADANGVDTDGDGLVDAVDWNLDGMNDEFTPHGTYGTGEPPIQGDGDSSIPAVPAANCLNDGGTHAVPYNTAAQYETIDVTRGSTSYRLITNGWGQNFRSHTISGQGTQMRVAAFEGDVGQGSSPAGYPTVYYGNYSNTGVSPGATLPRGIDAISSINTGLRWSHPAAAGAYNVAWDVWLSTSGSHSGYFMVWLRDPPTYRPAGAQVEENIVVAGVNGLWDLWAGHVNVFGYEQPIINYVRKEEADSSELGFELMDFFADAVWRGYEIPGTEIMSVAIGFEIWQGPVQDLGIDDFCVAVQ